MTEKELFEKVYDVLFEHDKDFIENSKKTDSKISELTEEDFFELHRTKKKRFSAALLISLTKLDRTALFWE